MNIAVIGAGNVGGTLANLWAGLGHQVWVGARDPQSEKTLAYQRSAHTNVHVTSGAEAAAQANVLLLATPWNAAQAAVAELGDVSGKVVIDATNPLGPGGQVLVGFSTSAAEQVAGWARGAAVVKAFSTTGVANMASPDFHGMKTDMFICGDDDAAKALVAQLIQELGMEVVDCGPLSMARNLEPLAAVWVYLAYSRGYGPGFIFKIIKK
jgi:8-hydroxy-5-deazaflavin:NADPH oxidoreductase